MNKEKTFYVFIDYKNINPTGCKIGVTISNINNGYKGDGVLINSDMVKYNLNDEGVYLNTRIILYSIKNKELAYEISKEYKIYFNNVILDLFWRELSLQGLPSPYPHVPFYEGYIDRSEYHNNKDNKDNKNHLYKELFIKYCDSVKELQNKNISS